MREQELNGKGTGPIEMLEEWEGQAIPAPGVLFEERQAAHLATEQDVPALAGWIGLTLFSGIGNSAYDVAKKKVLDVLTSWRHRFGQEKIDEVKQQLFQQMEERRRNLRITD